MDKRAVKLEIRRLADFRSTKITRFMLLFFLILHFFFTVYYQSGPYSLYIIPIALILPSAVTAILKNGINSNKSSGKEKAEKEYALSCLMSHYKFSPEGFLGESVTFYFLILVFMLWQKRNLAFPFSVAWYNYYPVFLMCFGVVMRLILYIFHRIFLPFKIIKHNY